MRFSERRRLDWLQLGLCIIFCQDAIFSVALEGAEPFKIPKFHEFQFDIFLEFSIFVVIRH
jgi:hypothetical protein